MLAVASAGRRALLEARVLPALVLLAQYTATSPAAAPLSPVATPAATSRHYLAPTIAADDAAAAGRQAAVAALGSFAAGDDTWSSDAVTQAGAVP